MLRAVSDEQPTRSVRLLDQPEDAGVCRSCLHQKRWVFLLVLLVIIDLIAAATLFGHGRHQALIMGILRALLLSFSFALAVKMGLGMWSCGAEGPEETHHATGEVSELDRQRAAVANREAHSWKRNLVLGICFVGVTVESTYTGIQVLSTEEETALEALCFTLVVACMNAEFLVMKYLVERLTEEEGVLLPGVHEHRLYYQKVAQIAFCKICRERIGTRTGKECDGGGRGSGFWVCLLCYRKSQNSNTQEGILRGDKGPKYVQELTSWQYFWRAIELCRPFRRVLQCAVLCTCITQLGRILLPNYQGSIINDLIAGNKQGFERLLTTFILVSVGTMLFGSVQSVCVEIVQRRITCDVRTVMFESLIKQDIAFFDGTMTGQLTSRMTNDVAAVVQPVRQIMNTFLTAILRLIGGLFMCLLTSWKLTVLAATMIGPVVYLTGVYAKWSKQVNMSIRVSMAEANAVSTEALRNIRTVRSFGADLLEVGAFRQHMDTALQNGMKDSYASAGVSAITQYLDFAATILILWYGGYAVLGEGQSDLQIGNLITFNLYWNMLNNSITGLNGMLNTLVKAASAAQRVFEIIDLEPDIPADEGHKGLDDGPVSLAFKEVCFYYPMRPDAMVLKGLSFTVGAGQTVAMVGKSGAGKSTLVGLMLRFYDPKGGQVLLNGEPLTEYNLRLYRKKVGVVSQDTQVFCRSILENLTYGLEPGEVPQQAEVEKAAEAASANDFIQKLEEKYQSMIGEGGTRLSGGQRQRVAIARALLRGPKLLLLDEATSALDAENEGKVQRALDDLVHSVHGNCSVVLIAHRLSTVIGADKIVVMDQGLVAEEGTHEELLKSDNIYAGLVKRQLAKEANVVGEDAAEAGQGKGKGRFKGKKAREGLEADSADSEAPDGPGQMQGKGRGKWKGRRSEGASDGPDSPDE